MADEHDSGSCVGHHVWVQVPSSALGKMVGNLIFQRFPIFLFVAKLGYSWVTTD